MDKTEIKVPVSIIVDAIVRFYNSDAEKVSAFYEAAYDKLWGVNPEIDAILDAIVDWLMLRHIDLATEDFDSYVMWAEAGQ